MRACRRDARTGWREPVSVVLESDPALLRYASDERSADWRFLLPHLPTGRALCVGGALSPAPLALAGSCRDVTVVCDREEGDFLLARAHDSGVFNIAVAGIDEIPVARGEYDLVAALRSPFGHGAWRQHLRALPGAVAAGGILYLEVDEPAVVRPPMLLKDQLKRMGFTRARLYWPKPTFQRCEMLFPLGSRRLQKYYLDNQFYAMSPGRKALRTLLRTAVAAGLFELTLPEYMVLARRLAAGTP